MSETPPSPRPARDVAIPGWKQALYAVSIVLAFFVLVDVVLWAVGYPTLLDERDPFQGFSERVRVFALDETQGLYATPRRAVAHSFNYQTFLSRKPENGFRSFTLGGSSAYGFPWGAREAFTRLLGDALQASWPGRKIEAVNAAAMSYGSHRLRILAHELLTYDPDILIVYEGHNEFIERRFYGELLGRRQELDALRQIAYRWRLYSLMTRVYERIAGKGPGSAPPRDAAGKSTAELLGLDVVREDVKDIGDAERAEVVRRFEENLRAIVEMAGRERVQVVLCTVPSNLSRWAPNQSLFGNGVEAETRETVAGLLAEAKSAIAKGDAASAAARLERAASLAPGHAEVRFQLGRAYEDLDRWDDARAEYVRARDADGAPSRAIGAINHTIRRVAAEGGAILVDVEKAFFEASAHGLPGFDLFEDYVHPKPEGHRLIAFELFRTFEERGLLGETRAADEAAFRRAVGAGTAPMVATDANAPEAATQAKTPASLYNLGIVLENQGLHDQAMEKYRECLALDPRYLAARDNLGRLLLEKGAPAEAAGEFAKAVEVDPRGIKSLVGLGESLRRLGRPAEALTYLDRAVKTDPKSAIAWSVLGETFLQSGRLADAESAFRRFAELDPANPDAWAKVGFACLFRTNLDEAQAAFRKSLGLRPDHSPSRNGLAAVLTDLGKYDEAERLFQESLRANPGDAGARQGLEILKVRREAKRR